LGRFSQDSRFTWKLKGEINGQNPVASPIKMAKEDFADVDEHLLGGLRKSETSRQKLPLLIKLNASPASLDYQQFPHALSCNLLMWLLLSAFNASPTPAHHSANYLCVRDI
jgi:hypothetical protein